MSMRITNQSHSQVEGAWLRRVREVSLPRKRWLSPRRFAPSRMGLNNGHVTPTYLTVKAEGKFVFDKRILLVSTQRSKNATQM
jgi:hypothetical protein